MPFSDFIGNAETVRRLRDMMACGHFPPAVILAGPRGSGKYTLALMLARAMNCLERPVRSIEPEGGTLFSALASESPESADTDTSERPPSSSTLPDFCGHCSNCVRIGLASDLDARFAEAVEARDNMREADKKETRIFVQTHPDIVIVPPDPPQMMIKVDQVRHVIHGIYYRPAEARERIYIFTSSAFMKEAANSLLKVLEEPPEFATIFLLTENPGELLPTIRSRSTIFTLGALAVNEIEVQIGTLRPEWNSRQRALVARLSEGALGRALSFDLEGYGAARAHGLAMLKLAIGAGDHCELFRITESYRPGTEGRQRIESLLRALFLLVEDVMFLQSGAGQLVRNIDIQAELKKIAEVTDFPWIEQAAARLDELERGLRRNLLRSLSLDAFAIALEKGV